MVPITWQPAGNVSHWASQWVCESVREKVTHTDAADVKDLQDVTQANLIAIQKATKKIKEDEISAKTDKKRDRKQKK